MAASAASSAAMGAAPSPAAVERDPRAELEEIINFWKFSLRPDASWSGTIVFDMPKTPVNPRTVFSVRVPPRGSTAPVESWWSPPPDGKYSAYVDISRDDFFFLYSGAAGAAAIASMCLTGRIRVRWLRFHELQGFAQSFDYASPRWIAFYRAYNMLDKADGMMALQYERAAALTAAARSNAAGGQPASTSPSTAAAPPPSAAVEALVDEDGSVLTPEQVAALPAARVARLRHMAELWRSGLAYHQVQQRLTEFDRAAETAAAIATAAAAPASSTESQQQPSSETVADSAAAMPGESQGDEGSVAAGASAGAVEAAAGGGATGAAAKEGAAAAPDASPARAQDEHGEAAATSPDASVAAAGGKILMEDVLDRTAAAAQGDGTPAIGAVAAGTATIADGTLTEPTSPLPATAMDADTDFVALLPDLLAQGAPSLAALQAVPGLVAVASAEDAMAEGAAAWAAWVAGLPRSRPSLPPLDIPAAAPPVQRLDATKAAPTTPASAAAPSSRLGAAADAVVDGVKGAGAWLASLFSREPPASATSAAPAALQPTPTAAAAVPALDGAGRAVAAAIAACDDAAATRLAGLALAQSRRMCDGAPPVAATLLTAVHPAMAARVAQLRGALSASEALQPAERRIPHRLLRTALNQLEAASVGRASRVEGVTCGAAAGAAQAARDVTLAARVAASAVYADVHVARALAALVGESAMAEAPASLASRAAAAKLEATWPLQAEATEASALLLARELVAAQTLRPLPDGDGAQVATAASPPRSAATAAEAVEGVTAGQPAVAADKVESAAVALRDSPVEDPAVTFARLAQMLRRGSRSQAARMGHPLQPPPEALVPASALAHIPLVAPPPPSVLSLGPSPSAGSVLSAFALAHLGAAASRRLVLTPLHAETLAWVLGSSPLAYARPPLALGAVEVAVPALALAPAPAPSGGGSDAVTAPSGSDRGVTADEALYGQGAHDPAGRGGPPPAAQSVAATPTATTASPSQTAAAASAAVFLTPVWHPRRLHAHRHASASAAAAAAREAAGGVVVQARRGSSPSARARVYNGLGSGAFADAALTTVRLQLQAALSQREASAIGAAAAVAATAGAAPAATPAPEQVEDAALLLGVGPPEARIVVAVTPGRFLAEELSYVYGFEPAAGPPPASVQAPGVRIVPPASLKRVAARLREGGLLKAYGARPTPAADEAAAAAPGTPRLSEDGRTTGSSSSGDSVPAAGDGEIGERRKRHRGLAGPFDRDFFRRVRQRLLGVPAQAPADADGATGSGTPVAPTLSPPAYVPGFGPPARIAVPTPAPHAGGDGSGNAQR